MKRDIVKSAYAPLLSKTLTTAIKTYLTNSIMLVGPAIIELITDNVVKICESHYVDKDRLKAGQMLWYAVDINDPPCKGKTMARTKLKPIVLTVIAPEDVERVLEKKPMTFINQKRMARVCAEAHAQGAVLAEADVSMIYGYHYSWVSQLLCREESETKVMVPRRGNIHDMGSTLSHKRLIIYKHFVDHMQTPEIARVTNHSASSVDRYIKDFQRVRHCLVFHRMGLLEIVMATGLSLRLVKEYIAIIHELEPHLESTSGN